ncbi:MAG: T9SS type A sorting domain-containing protein [Bacteroidota bacterium]
MLNATQDTVFLTLIAKCTQAVTGAMVAHNVVIEKNIHFNTPPGNNGEKDFKNVMKKMLPTYSGTAIPSSMSNGDYTIIETFWKLANVYDLNQLAAVSWIQNTSTKEIHQTTNNTTVPLVFPSNTDLQAMEISNIIPNNCSGKITPVLKIRNNGNNTITSFQVKYQVNNGTVSSYTWNGSLTSLQKTLVTLPEYSFTPTTTNILKIYSTSPNSTSDEYPKNDTATFSIAGAKVTTNMLFLQLKTDNRPQETSWDVKNSAGQVVVSHGAYTLPNHISIDTINLPSYDCYKFTMYDAGNNGLCCSFGVGGFELDDAPGGVILQGNTFGSIIANELSYDNATGIRIIESLNGLSVYPNPFSGQTTVSFNLPHESPVTIQVTNLLGQVEKNFYFGILSTGSHAVGMDCGNLAKGIYLLDLHAGAERKM